MEESEEEGEIVLPDLSKSKYNVYILDLDK